MWKNIRRRAAETTVPNSCSLHLLKNINEKRLHSLTGMQPLRFAVSAVCLLHLCNDGLESLGVVQGEIGKHLAVDFDSSLRQSAHQL